MSLHGIKIVVSEGYVGGALVVIAGRYIVVAVLGQEDLMFNVKELVEVRGGGSGAATVLEFWTMEGYDVGFLIGVAAVLVIIIFGGEEITGSVLSGVSFDDAFDIKIEGVMP